MEKRENISLSAVKHWYSKLNGHQNPPEEMVKTQISGPAPGNFSFVRSGVGLDNFISNKVPGDEDIAGYSSIVHNS